jgi:hypothetical protein
MKWLPNMDLNHDKQIQRLLCYRYTIRQMGRQIYGVCAGSQAMGMSELGGDCGGAAKRRRNAALRDAVATGEAPF